MAISFSYLPSEGLQGEDIPSYVIWEDMNIESICISFRSPLIFKEVYNSNSWEIQEDKLVVKAVELDGYLGLLFESRKVSAIADDVSVEYSFHLSNGEVVKETRVIKVFRPQLEIGELPKKITVNPDTGFVKNRIRVKNTGRGTLIMRISTPEDSPARLETPPEYRDFIERFESDLREEMSILGKKFPQFEPLLEEMLEWDERIRDLEKISEEDKKKFIDYMNKFLRILANNREFHQGLLEAFAKALIKNTELVQTIGRFVEFYESLVSKNILLVNPFDQFNLTKDGQEMILKVKQTDRVFDEYEDITLPKIKLEGSKIGKISIHRLFEWG